MSVIRFMNKDWAGPLLAMIVVSLLVGATTQRFYDINNLRNLALQVSIVAIIAIGSSIVIYTGGIDLSPGSMIALITMVLATLVKTAGAPFALTIVACLVLGAIMGALNGSFSTYLRIPSFITTLAAMSIFRGVAFLFNKGSPIFSVDTRLEALFYKSLLGIPLPFYYVMVLYAAAFFILRYTRLGREIYAVGGNANAARLSGINVKRVQLVAFVLAGVAAAVAAILMAGRLNSGSPNYGVGMELAAIAAAVIGGASLSGGQGNIVATLFGALTIVIVQNGLNLNAVPTSLQNIIIGFIILIAVLIDRWRNEISGLFRSKVREEQI